MADRLDEIIWIQQINEIEQVIDQGQCDICGKPAEECPSGLLYLDTDPATCEIRGYLCSTCDAGLALLGDDLEAVNSAKVYLG